MNNRPVSIDFRTIRMPMTAILSILHRISGVLLFLGMPILLWMFGRSLGSTADFQDLQLLLDNILFKLIFFGILAALIYHIIAGTKHLLMDLGIGETEQGSKIASRMVLVASLISIIILGVKLL